MSTYKGSIQRLTEFTGKVRKKLPQLKVQILPRNTISNAKISASGGYGGSWYKRIGFGAVVKPLSAIFRFLTFRNRIISTHTAKAISAPAVELEADSKIADAKMDATLTAQPVADLQTDNKIKTSLTAKLVAYNRAALRYIKGLLSERTAKLIAAPGAVAKFRKKMPLTVKIQTIAAPGAVMESRFNRIDQTLEAAAISAPAEIAKVETTLAAEHTAKATTAAAISVNLDSAFKVTHCAPLYAWFFAVQDGNTLYIPQAFSGIQTGNTLEIDLETESAYWANAFNNDGVLHLVFAETATPNNNILEVE